jgi:hypothetical protein
MRYHEIKLNYSDIYFKDSEINFKFFHVKLMFHRKFRFYFNFH